MQESRNAVAEKSPSSHTEAVWRILIEHRAIKCVVIVSWLVSRLNFQLQETIDLSFPNSWSSVLQFVVINVGQISVIVFTIDERKFFRLKSQ